MNAKQNQYSPDRPNLFDTDSANRLYEYLTEAQKALAAQEVYHADTDNLMSSLPKDHKELRAIAVLLYHSLYYRYKVFAVPLLRFRVVGEPHQGVFTIPNYSLYTGCSCLTEDWKEYEDCQALPQDLTDLCLWLID